MPKIQFTGKQYYVTISEDNLKRMGWEKGTEVYIAKDPNREMLYIEVNPNINKKGGKNVK